MAASTDQGKNKNFKLKIVDNYQLSTTYVQVIFES